MIKPRSEGTRWELSRQVQFGLDLLCLVFAFLMAYLLRFDFVIPTEFKHQFLVQLPYVVLIQFLTLFLTGIYSFVWRYIGLAELGAFLKAAIYSALPLLLQEADGWPSEERREAQGAYPFYRLLKRAKKGALEPRRRTRRGPFFRCCWSATRLWGAGRSLPMVG